MVGGAAAGHPHCAQNPRCSPSASASASYPNFAHRAVAAVAAIAAGRAEQGAANGGHGAQAAGAVGAIGTIRGPGLSHRHQAAGRAGLLMGQGRRGAQAFSGQGRHGSAASCVGAVQRVLFAWKGRAHATPGRQSLCACCCIQFEAS